MIFPLLSTHPWTQCLKRTKTIQEDIEQIIHCVTAEITKIEGEINEKKPQSFSQCIPSLETSFPRDLLKKENKIYSFNIYMEIKEIIEYVVNF